MFPSQVSTQAIAVDTMFAFMLGLAGFFLLLVVVPLVYFVVKYRRRDENEVPPQIRGNVRLEVLWTVVPLILALGVFTWGAKVYVVESQPPADAEQIYVVGKQWVWKFQHANGRQEIGELHVPVAQPVRLTMVSQDVIHSFFVPDFRVKQDVLPGRYTTLWFQATRAGEFGAFCAEYCGTDHALMQTKVVAQDAPAYQQWLGAGPAGGPGAEGARLFQALGCAACHHADSGGLAPTLVDLYGRQVRLQSGEAVTADDNYLRESILAPQAKIVEGYQPVMPSFAGRVDEEQLIQLITYIKSLSVARPATPATPARSATP